MQELQIALRRFKTELTDVKLQFDMSVSIAEFPRFADCYFDDIFTSIGVLNKIKASERRVQDVANKLGQVVGQLNTLLKDVGEERAKMKEDLAIIATSCVLE